jgi:RNA polymerase sigma-70 factor (ECF subfamily)
MLDSPGPAPGQEAARLVAFDEQRRLLFSIAYRMLGSIADTEDMLQEAFIRWQQASDDDIRSPRAFLVTIVSRLCINHLQSARVRHERPVDHWLPEPLVTDPLDDPLGVLRVDESLSMALLVLLERLTPVERAVFLLREVFGFTYAEIAQSLGHSEENCRQSFHRARGHVGKMRRRFKASSQQHQELLKRFLEATRNGDVDGLLSLLSHDVVLRIDGGATTPFPNAIAGPDNISRVLLGGARSLPAGIVIRPTTINGDAGVVSYIEGRPYSVLLLDVREGLIQSVFIVADPEKLLHIQALHEAP